MTLDYGCKIRLYRW